MPKRPLPFDAAADGGLRVTLKVTPKAARAAIVGADADGNAFLKVAVTAAPERGKANAAAIKLLARAWRLPPSSLSMTSLPAFQPGHNLIACDRMLPYPDPTRIIDGIR